MNKLVKINSKNIPMVGLGTWQTDDQTTERSIAAALDIGYRHFDTAFNYNNEEAIGRALKLWLNSGKGKREDLFISTKLPHIGNRPEDVSYFLSLSLERLQLDYVDLYLIHLPFGFFYDKITLTPLIDTNGIYHVDHSTDHVAIWKILEAEVAKGRIKQIGLSNFNVKQIRKVYFNAEKIKPAVIQVELHAYMQQVEIRKLSEELNMVVIAYAPLGSSGSKEYFVKKYKFRAEKFPDILGHPVVQKIANKHNRSAAQILLRHLVQQEVVVIPKSTHPERMKQNLSIFDFQLSTNEIKQLNDLDRGDKGRILNFVYWRGVENHPEYPFPKECLYE